MNQGSQATVPFRDAIIALIPALRAFALRLGGARCDVDDLVQETLVRAWRYRDTYHEGTNLKSWLCKILQNCFYADCHGRRGVIEDVDGRWAAQQIAAPTQEWHLRYNEILSALNRLTPDTREALVLVVADGFSYEEAAGISGCPVGTLKSRVNRARERLAELTDGYGGSVKGAFV